MGLCGPVADLRLLGRDLAGTPGGQHHVPGYGALVLFIAAQDLLFVAAVGGVGRLGQQAHVAVGFAHQQCPALELDHMKPGLGGQSLRVADLDRRITLDPRTCTGAPQNDQGDSAQEQDTGQGAGDPPGIE